MKPRVYNRLAETFESSHVQGDIIVDQENRPCAVIAGVAYVRQYPIERIRVELTAPHRDVRAEAAIKSTTTGGFNDVHLAAQHRVTAEDTRIAIGKPYLTGVKPANRTIGIVTETPVLSEGQT